jgi:hypothetical protein
MSRDRAIARGAECSASQGTPPGRDIGRKIKMRRRVAAEAERGAVIITAQQGK